MQYIITEIQHSCQWAILSRIIPKFSGFFAWQQSIILQDFLKITEKLSCDLVRRQTNKQMDGQWQKHYLLNNNNGRVRNVI